MTIAESRQLRSLLDAVCAGLIAAVTSGVPSTAWALWRGEDPLVATRAAGAMLIAADSGDARLVAAAAIVHVTISLFWARVLAWLLPRRWTVASAIAAAAAIAVLDLLVIGRLFFPEVAALAFGPQFLDHLAWGATAGVVIAWRDRRKQQFPAP